MAETTIGLLLSGGLDSAIMLGHLLSKGLSVQPFYVKCELHWEAEESSAVQRLLAAMDSDRIAELVTLSQPLADLYQDHWSVTGNGVPDEKTPDEAVYLPGRNVLLLMKPALWCQLNGIQHLALGPLAGNPFADATDAFFDRFERTLNQPGGARLRIIRPFARLNKTAVLQMRGVIPLEHTFSCIDPLDGLHCGRCNKCAERQKAFHAASIDDPVLYDRQLQAAAVPGQ